MKTERFFFLAFLFFFGKVLSLSLAAGFIIENRLVANTYSAPDSLIELEGTQEIVKEEGEKKEEGEESLD